MFRESDVESFAVTVSKDYLGFSSAHFITLRGHTCEALHGHNYRVGVTVTGGVDPECAFVVDFAVLKRILKPHVDAIDHRVLLPTGNEKLMLREEQDMLTVEYLGRHRYSFPRTDCALLPVSNTTAEMLAEYFARLVHRELREAGYHRLEAVEVDVEENVGQLASFRMTIGDGDLA